MNTSLLTGPVTALAKVALFPARTAARVLRRTTPAEAQRLADVPLHEGGGRP